MTGLLRVYLDPAEIRQDGYPYVWHHPTGSPPGPQRPAIKDHVCELAGHRCERCGHPYMKGANGSGEWSPCDERCIHEGPIRYRFTGQHWNEEVRFAAGWRESLNGAAIEARWRILTVHHLNGVKHDCRWWNLAALCQRCHLTIQGRVLMERVYPFEHSEWFKPHAAGWYAASYLDLDLSREETMARLDELLALERAA